MLYGLLIIIATISCLSSCKNNDAQQPINLTQYVDPYIGTGDHGHVFTGANVPFGFVQLGPTQHTQGWDWCSGYHYSDSTIIGFGHLHLSGTGIGDLGDISLMPVIGSVPTTRGKLPDESTGIYSYFSHDNETAKPGYYSVLLDRFGINVEVTATPRVGFHKYTFPSSDDARIIIDLEHGIGWDTPAEGYIVQENDTIVSGYRKSKGWAKNQQIYFTAVFSKPMKNFIVFEQTEQKEGNSITAQRAYGQAIFDAVNKEPIFVKVALSAVSIENAKLNMQSELNDWDFEGTTANAGNAWNKLLSKIIIETSDNSIKRSFYTALYHSAVAPSVFCDVNGDYRGSDAKVYNDTSYINYTTFSLWDTYRAAHPLMTIIHPELTQNVGKTMLNSYSQQGKLPVWHLMGNETDCMIGNPGIPVLADMILKGYDINKELAFEAMKSSAMLDERGLKWLKEYGYVPHDKDPEHETVAKTLEYALADWCIVQVAKELDKTDDYTYFIKRSESYKRLFDKETQFMRGLSSDGKFREPFNPFRSSHRIDDYTEGNAWQYTWLVPHDVRGLIDLFSNEQAFIAKLDSLFILEGDLGEDASPDISGLIGQYAHGNEPSHHIVYLYSYVGQPWKTATRVREILTTLYHDAPTGLSGNEDVGQMSSWYILSSLGFYQVAPAGGIYVFGSPLINKATLDIGNDKIFTINTINNSQENIYIQSVTLNGKPYTKSYISYADIKAGGKLVFTMGNRPSDTFGIDKNDRP
ncbi:MAG: GH92 family glycosyl hydrolase [Prevotellaceae bacterium]|jgi:predicted alpha-1,2-mannosidase|nr:GH92 family glycosyl hydrolase [Prevotellaceae bacterium]